MLRLLLTALFCGATACTPSATSHVESFAPVAYVEPGTQPVDATAPFRIYGVDALRTGRIDHVLHGVGPMWNAREVESYANEFQRTPPLLVRMGVNLAPSARTSFDALIEKLRGFIRHHKTRIPVITILFRTSLGRGQMQALDTEVSDGRFDTQLDQLVDLLSETKRPVFLRIGPEVNNPGNGHNPRAFVKAYRYIVDYFRAAGADNAIYMWNYKAQRGLQVEPELWYPGDAWVDWWSIDVFGADLQLAELRNRVVDFLRNAGARGKPVMIPECAPSKLDMRNDAVWREWFQPFFDMIRRYPVIRGFCYSNRDFTKHVGLESWGDMRIERSPLVRRWRAELGKSLYLHAQAEPQGAAPSVSGQR